MAIYFLFSLVEGKKKGKTSIKCCFDKKKSEKAFNLEKYEPTSLPYYMIEFNIYFVTDTAVTTMLLLWDLLPSLESVHARDNIMSTSASQALRQTRRINLRILPEQWQEKNI